MKSFNEWREDKFEESQPPEKKNRDGGYDPPADKEQKWKKADLITLPVSVPGTNCGNCEYFEKSSGTGWCKHPEVKEWVTPRMCCCFWSHPSVKRKWIK